MITLNNPDRSPSETPTIAPVKPGTQPLVNPNKINNPKPSVSPSPKA